MTWIDRVYTVYLRCWLVVNAGIFSRARAQSTVEYALVGALVVIAAAGALTLLGGQLNSVFSSISKTLSTAAAR